MARAIVAISVACVKHLKHSFAGETRTFPTSALPSRNSCSSDMVSSRVSSPQTWANRPLLQAFRVQAEASAVPHQDLRSLPIAGDEQIHVARERVALEVLLDEPVQAVKALPHIRRQTVGEHPYRTGGTDHPRTCSNEASSSASRPSTTKPRGVTNRSAAAAWCNCLRSARSRPAAHRLPPDATWQSTATAFAASLPGAPRSVDAIHRPRCKQPRTPRCESADPPGTASDGQPPAAAAAPTLRKAAFPAR